MNEAPARNQDREGAALTVKEAAARLGVSDKLVYSLCKAGKIVHERHGLGRGTIRITEEALEEYRRQARVELSYSTPVPLKHLSPPPSRPTGRREPS
jgi:excisionase family DNA binding protein